jgi:hypothetical protein
MLRIALVMLLTITKADDWLSRQYCRAQLVLLVHDACQALLMVALEATVNATVRQLSMSGNAYYTTIHHITLHSYQKQYAT